MGAQWSALSFLVALQTSLRSPSQQLHQACWKNRSGVFSAVEGRPESQKPVKGSLRKWQSPGGDAAERCI